MELLVTSWMIIFVVFLLSIILAIVYDRRLPLGYPPGPAGVPVLGYLPWLSSRPYKNFHEMSKRYGSFFSVRIGSRWTVVLNGHSAIREALVQKGSAFSGRPTWVVNKIHSGRAVANEQPGDVWRLHRAFWMGLPRVYGKEWINSIINQEATHLVKAMETKNGDAFNPTLEIQLTFYNIISSICFGKRYDGSDTEFLHLQKQAHDYMQNLTRAHVASINPFVGKAKATKIFNKMLNAHQNIIRFIQERIEEHKAAMEHGRHVKQSLLNSFYGNAGKLNDSDNSIATDTDTVLDESRDSMVNNNDQVKSRSLDIEEDNLPHIVLDVFVGGIETINASLLWSLLFMMKYPDVQRRVQHEIDSTFGEDELPNYQLKHNMPFTRATLLEVHRLGNVIPIAIPHTVRQPVEFHGHVLPVGVKILPNIYSAHMDHDQWPEPTRFDPTRFLDGNGNIRIPQSYMPFSVGKRVCMGEQLAQMESFITFTAILQKFTIVPDDTSPLPGLDGTPGTTCKPLPFKIKAIRRTERAKEH